MTHDIARFPARASRGWPGSGNWRGERPHLSDLLLTSANALRLTDQLSRLRGAAMKLGQMIPLDAGDMLPAELSAILARLREGAHRMPAAHVNRMLTDHLGADVRMRDMVAEAVGDDLALSQPPVQSDRFR